MSDIRELLCEIKQNVSTVEQGHYDPPLLREIETDFLHFLELAKLFLISERDSYYGYFLMNMQFRVSFTANSIAGIRLNEFPAVLEVNPLLLCKFTLKEILYVLCHEIDHIVLGHPVEMVKVNPNSDPDVFYRFNLAADASVNDRIAHEIKTEDRKFLSSPEGVITSATLSKMFHLRNVAPLESYAYYFQLISKKGKTPQSNHLQNGQEGMLEGHKLQENNTKTAPTNETIVTVDTCSHLQDHDWGLDDNVEDAIAAVQEFVNAAVGMMSKETRDMIPSTFFSQVELLNTPAQLSWQAVLKKYIGTISANKRKTQARFNRRQPERFDLSGTMSNKILKIVVAIDTSGSVDDKMIAQIFREIFAILSKRKHAITVIECDSEIQRVYNAKSISDIKTKVKGRGGTCFSPVVEYLNHDRYFQDALLIYFTDGFGERSIPKPKTYRNIWVVFDDSKNLSVKEPYGAVLQL